MSEVLIQNWVIEQLACGNAATLHWQALAGDASFRHYFRCQHDGVHYIVASAPPATEKNHEFVQISGVLKAAGIKASEVIAVNYEQGFILQKDLGEQLLADRLTPASVDQFYGYALQQLLQMQQIPTAALVDIPAYDEATLQLELSYFIDWFVQSMLEHTLSESERITVQAFFAELCQSAIKQPQGFVHRDYHCRNIMITETDELATIDFQDALVGPLTYDLVSLLRDCYVVWPQEKTQFFTHHFWNMLIQSQCVDEAEWPLSDFSKAFDLMGLQRHIKVLGVFARLSLRDGKHGYLEDLPTVINYVRETLKNVAVTSVAAQEFSVWFEAILMPLIDQQVWWTPKLIEKNIMEPAL